MSYTQVPGQTGTTTGTTEAMTPGSTTPPSGYAAGADEMQSKRIAEGVNEEYHDPYDDWSSRDTLLAFVPAIIAFALQDGHFRLGLIIATAASAFLLVMRTVAWDSRYKKVWPMVELTSLPLFAILLGLSYVSRYQIEKWFPTIVGLTFAFMTLLSLMWRRPWTAHYARYPKFDRGGCLLWRHTPSWRHHSDKATFLWLWAFVVFSCLSLIPQLTGHHRRSHGLNVVFNYIVPAICALTALILQQMTGNAYRKKTVRNLDRYFGRAHVGHIPGTGNMPGADNYPAGPAMGGGTPANV